MLLPSIPCETSVLITSPTLPTRERSRTSTPSFFMGPCHVPGTARFAHWSGRI